MQPTLRIYLTKVEANRGAIQRVALAFGTRQAHRSTMRDFHPEDYAVAVKLRADPPLPWRWEIYCAGKRLPIERSSDFFATMGAAHVAGKKALTQLIDRLAA